MVQRNTSAGLRSGALAKAAGVSPDTVRYYERIGVLPRAVRTSSGYRVYPQNTVERVLVVQRALRIGFSLAELAEVLQARDAGRIPCRRVFQMASEKLKGIRTNIQALRRMERYLKTVLAEWEVQMHRAAPGQKAHLLHSLVGVEKISAEKTNRLLRRRKS